MSDLIFYAASLIAVFLVFVPHELAHGYVAYLNGDYTAKINGRLTLNPIKHIDLMGLVMCVLVGYGWAKPVPINSDNFNNYKVGLFTTAIAGVVVNYIFAFISYPIYLAITKYAHPSSEAMYYLLYFVRMIFYLTYLYGLTIFVFNLLPFNPLDGFRVVQSLTSPYNRVRKFLEENGKYILLFLVAESFICRMIARYTGFSDIQYFNILGFYVQWFAQHVIGWPITAIWNLVFGI